MKVEYKKPGMRVYPIRLAVDGVTQITGFGVWYEAGGGESKTLSLSFVIKGQPSSKGD